jgi:hypothetical protein
MDHLFYLTKKRLISGNRTSTYIYYNTIRKELSIKLAGNLVVWLVLLIIGPPQITSNKTLRWNLIFFGRKMAYVLSIQVQLQHVLLLKDINVWTYVEFYVTINTMDMSQLLPNVLNNLMLWNISCKKQFSLIKWDFGWYWCGIFWIY